jgi:hypothetical protein
MGGLPGRIEGGKVTGMENIQYDSFFSEEERRIIDECSDILYWRKVTKPEEIKWSPIGGKSNSKKQKEESPQHLPIQREFMARCLAQMHHQDFGSVAQLAKDVIAIVPFADSADPKLSIKYIGGRPPSAKRAKIQLLKAAKQIPMGLSIVRGQSKLQDVNKICDALNMVRSAALDLDLALLDTQNKLSRNDEKFKVFDDVEIVKVVKNADAALQRWRILASHARMKEKQVTGAVARKSRTKNELERKRKRAPKFDIDLMIQSIPGPTFESVATRLFEIGESQSIDGAKNLLRRMEKTGLITQPLLRGQRGRPPTKSGQKFPRKTE